MKPKRSQRLTVRLEPELREALSKEASERHLGDAAIVREALRIALKHRLKVKARAA